MSHSSEEYHFGPHKKILVSTMPGKGRGLVAQEDIAKGEIIDVTPVLILDNLVTQFLMKHPAVADSLFLWRGTPENVTQLAIGFGNASMCNHSLRANSRVVQYENPTPRVVLIAIDLISVGSEITIEYAYPLQEMRA